MTMQDLGKEVPKGIATDNIVERTIANNKVMPNERQQNKIIGFLSDDSNAFRKNNVELEPGVREDFLKKLASGIIPEGKLDKLVTTITPPLEFDELWKRMTPQMKGVIGNSVSVRQGLVVDLNSGLLPEFLNFYPNPQDFLNYCAKVSRRYKEGSLERNRVENAALLISERVYGKRWEYFLQARLLKNEAMKLDATKKTEEPLKRGDYTVDKLKELGLGPKYGIQVGDVAYYFSSAYELEEGRFAVVGYVRTADNKIEARSYYLSRSQIMWRALPTYSADDRGNITWYGKGYAGMAEESLNLPASVQAKLSEVLAGGVLVGKEYGKVFTGLSRKIKGLVDLDPDYESQVERTPKKLEGIDYSRNLPKPENIRLDPKMSPDFSVVEERWQVKNELYGNVEMRSFLSRDGSLKYTFCRDSLGRSWIGSIEVVVSEIGSMGLKRDWCEADALTVPAFEYRVNLSGSFEFANLDMQKLEYIDMYKNYLSRIPVIKEFNKNFPSD